MPKVKVTIGSEVKLRLKSGLGNNLNLQANLKKLHEKIKRSWKVCHTEEQGFHIQGQGHNQGSGVKSFLCDYL